MTSLASTLGAVGIRFFRRAALAPFVLALACSGGEQGGVVPTGKVSQRLGSPNLVISQVYTAGGNTGATFKYDYVEIFNRGTSAVSLAGKSIQFKNATASGLWAVVTFDAAATIEPGKYFLYQLAPGNTSSTAPDLPAPDATSLTTSSFGLNSTTVRVALVDGVAPLNCHGTCATAATTDAGAAVVIDLVGLGVVPDFEGALVPTAPTSVQAAFRNGAGCTDTDNNLADFTVSGPPAPRNSGTARNDCAAADAGATDAATDDASTDAPDAADDADAMAPDAADDAAAADDAMDGAPSDDAATSDADDAATSDADDAATSDADDAATTDSATATDATPADTGPVTMLLNEARWNPSLTDGLFEYVELTGQGTIPSGTYVVAVEGDAVSSVGRLHWYRDLSGVTFGSNGIIMIKAAGAGCAGVPAGTTVVDDTNLAAAPIQNGSESLVLFRTNDGASLSLATGTSGTLYSSFASNVTVVDAIGWRDSASETIHGGVDLAGVLPPHAASRFLGNTTALSADAWFYGRLTGQPNDVTYDGSGDAGVSATFPAGGFLTPGAPNDLTGTPSVNCGTSTVPADAGGTDATTADTSVTTTDATTTDSAAATDGTTTSDTAVEDVATAEDAGDDTTAASDTGATSPVDSGSAVVDTGFVDEVAPGELEGGGCSCEVVAPRTNNAYAIGLAFAAAMVAVRRRRQAR